MRRGRFRPPVTMVLAALLASSTTLEGCSRGPAPAGSAPGTAAGQGGDADAPRTSAALTPEQQAKVLARVGDRTVTLGEYAAALEQMDQFDRLRYQSPERRQELLNEMINVELLAAEAKAKGYDQDPETQEQLRLVLRDAMLERARAGAKTPGEVTPDEVKAFYDAHREEYRDPERRRLSMVVTKDLATAQSVLAEVLAAEKAAPSGVMEAEAWGALVQTKSVDPQAHANVPRDLAGDVGIFGPAGDPRGDSSIAKGRVPDDVRAAGFRIGKVGEVLPEVVKGAPSAAAGPGAPAVPRFYVVRLTQILAPVERTMPEAERSIRVRLAQESVRAKERALIDDLKREYPVQIDEAALAKVKVAPADAGP